MHACACVCVCAYISTLMGPMGHLRVLKLSVDVFEIVISNSGLAMQWENVQGGIPVMRRETRGDGERRRETQRDVDRIHTRSATEQASKQASKHTSKHARCVKRLFSMGCAPC